VGRAAALIEEEYEITHGRDDPSKSLTFVRDQGMKARIQSNIAPPSWGTHSQLSASDDGR
jgi:hypothetical protein